VVLGQAEVGAKTNEIPMFTRLLDRIDIAGAVITADAMHAHAGYLAGRGAHYLLTVKGNQPVCTPSSRPCPGARFPSPATPGRAAMAGLSATPQSHIGGRRAGLPPRPQAIQIVRRRRLKKKWSTQTCYAVTSLTVTQASPTQLAAIIRGHWAIEDRLHWVRDMD
jgi:predicted transposase YbfD/YdcC